MFDLVRRLELDDGRTLLVFYQGERYGWGAEVEGESQLPSSASSPGRAIAAYLGLSEEQVPASAKRLSEQYERDLDQAPRYVCDCCGYRTLLNTGRYEICVVCRWEDDRVDNNRLRGGPDAPSGPNHISLTDARANFARFGASNEKSKKYARLPKPEEYPSS